MKRVRPERDADTLGSGKDMVLRGTVKSGMRWGCMYVIPHLCGGSAWGGDTGLLCARRRLWRGGLRGKLISGRWARGSAPGDVLELDLTAVHRNSSAHRCVHGEGEPIAKG